MLCVIVKGRISKKTIKMGIIKYKIMLSSESCQIVSTLIEQLLTGQVYLLISIDF